MKRSSIYKALTDLETLALLGVIVLFTAAIIWGVLTEIDKISKFGLNVTHPIIADSVS